MDHQSEALTLFQEPAYAPQPRESALLDLVLQHACLQYSGHHPHDWFIAVENACEKIANPNWRNDGDFPPLIRTLLVDALNAALRSYACNDICETPTGELREKLPHARWMARHWTEEIHAFELAIIENELAERAIIEQMTAAPAA